MNKVYFVLIFLLILKFALQYFLIGPGWELHRDEYMHLDQGEHLAWGYISVPPVTSWISWIIIKLGNSIFWIKFFPALFGALTMLIVWKIVEELKGGTFAATLATIAVLFSVIARINILYQPNSFDILAWTALYFVVIKYVNTKDQKLLYIASIVFALGFLNKYNIAFLVLGLLLALLITKHREIFKTKHLYFAALLALIVIGPNLYWQYTNDFPVLHHMRELARTQLVNVRRTDFLKEQALFFFGSFFVLVAAFVSFFANKPFKSLRFILWSFLFTMAIFIILRAKGYYAIGLYPVLLAVGSIYLERIFTSRWRRYLRPLALLIPAFMFIPFTRIAFPMYSPEITIQRAEAYKSLGLLRWEDGKDHHLPQDFADMLGWKELAFKVDSAYRTASQTGNTIVITDNYGQAGAINFYSTINNINAVSLNADYINWFPLDEPIRHVILVKDIYDKNTLRKEEAPYFNYISLTGSIEHPYAREKGTKIYLLSDAKVDINSILRKEINEEILSMKQ